ncbi:MAG: TauD/TfdA family dioxygenase [Gammaproteobacteria bacterium TMED92]|nr:MAG: TauD/TfdA family dioxygenase [Gammaproteobacteria bacterium TMED92]
MRITPIVEEHFVADVEDVDLLHLSEQDFDEIYQAWLQFGVLRFRNQPLDDSGLQKFSARFGPLEEMPLGRMSEQERKKIANIYVAVLSNIRVNGKAIGGLGNAEASWHSDMTYVDTPPPASVLLGVEIPAAGGDTYFSDQNAAYAELPNALRQRVRHLTIKHNAAHTSIGSLRPGYQAFDDPREAPGSVHPIVRSHEETGTNALYLGRREWAYIPGLSLAESEALLDELWSYAAYPQHVWQQQWQPNDVVIWDNRRVLHRRDDFDNNARRLMKRCQVLARSTNP